jgi:transcription antitermination factor NusA-like protein
MSSLEMTLPGEAPCGIVTLRMLMAGKDVGNIIGKGGETISSLREESGTKISINEGSCIGKKYISDESCPERIITVSGTIKDSFKAFTMIFKKMEEKEDTKTNIGTSFSKKNKHTSHFIVPSCQCGALIGKGGSKIKHIREVTGASVQVASDLLPGSTERLVTVSGSRDEVTQCIYHICCTMIESPAKGTNKQYEPGQEGREEGRTLEKSGARNFINELLRISDFGTIPSKQDFQLGRNSKVMSNDRGRTRDMEHRGRREDWRKRVVDRQSEERDVEYRGRRVREEKDEREREREERDKETCFKMRVPNELIGSVIGQGGSKIAEIRQMSGARIKISRDNDPEESLASQREIQITGRQGSVEIAKRLINISLDLHKVKSKNFGIT